LFLLFAVAAGEPFKSRVSFTVLSLSRPRSITVVTRREIMTTQECDSRDRRIVENIRTMLQASPTLRQHASLLEVSIERSAIVIRGNLPSAAMKAEVVPVIRQAGVLSQINNCVLVSV